MSNLLTLYEVRANQKNIFLDRYQYLLSIAATFLFFSELPNYLWAAPLIPLNPLFWIILLFILSIPFLKNIKNTPKLLLLWMAIYLGISTLSLLTVSSDDISFTDYRSKVLACLFILVMCALYQQKSLTHIKYTIIIVVFLSIGNNLFELFHPRFFSELNVGRPAGFYIDPNQAGCEILLGMIVGMETIAKRYRWLFMTIVAVGVFATFSRGAIIGWVICAIIFIFGKVFSNRRLKATILMVLAIAFIAALNPLQNLADYFRGDPDNWDIVNRLEDFQNPTEKEDSATERKLVAAGGWMMFGNHPFWGNGLASTRKWDIAEVSTHNVYLYNMADNGIIGLIFLPGAILGLTIGNQGEKKVYIISFAIFIGIWGCFSQEVLAERATLTIFSIFAAMNVNQKWYLKYTNKNSRFQIEPPLVAPDLKLPPLKTRKVLPRDRF